MSQFHWHVTDSQSFPLVIPGFTELANAGAYDPTMVYSANDVKDITDYAGAVSVCSTFFADFFLTRRRPLRSEASM